MSSKAKRLQKETLIRFPIQCYNDTVFTLLLSANIQQENKYADKDIMRLAKEIEIDFADENWTKQFIKDFGKNVDFRYIVAAVNPKTGNMLFAPYFDNQVLSLREDGYMPNTMINGRYIVFTKEN